MLAQVRFGVLVKNVSYINISLAPTDFPTFAPSLVFQCLQSVPLDKTAAADFINWLKPYLQFQSTIGWLKNPPPSYQQPAVDLLGGLDAISSKVSSNGYKNEYEFEAAVAQLLQQSQYVTSQGSLFHCPKQVSLPFHCLRPPETF
jgi:hypothetical protein